MSLRGKRLFSVNCTLGLACLTLCCSVSPLFGQESSTSSSGRWLAPDALVTIAPAMEPGETFQGPVDLPLVLNNPDIAWDPHYAPKSDTLAEMGRDVVFRGEVYCLEFSFKPVRMIAVDIPSFTGVQRKNVWYLLYRVRYLGGDLRPQVEPDAFGNQVFATPQSVAAETISTPKRFFPVFRLQVKGIDREYPDEILPAAKRAIAARERVGQPLYDTVEIMKQSLPVTTAAGGHSLWGVATWVDVDPRTDFFAVLVQGLTNAQQLKMQGEQIEYLQKTLVLHFSRPGDTMDEMQDRIRYGIPALEDPQRQQYILDQFGVEKRLDHLWTYR
ncbi:MAG: hypothetical protein KDA45_10835 [Planctomycetales bacterium]|nr:hypothetical protein [Planctomycetales bacterium]